MRLSLALLSLALASGCAHTVESVREDRVVVAVDAKGSATEVTEPPPLLIAEPPTSRPRLSRTLTLGEGSVEPVYQANTSQAMQGQGQGGPNVVVNNNITVVSAPPVVYSGYGYGGYGGGYGRASGAPSNPNRGQTQQAYPPSGWEGAGRTAAPGMTPHVGGNWPAAPSHGPRQFK